MKLTKDEMALIEAVRATGASPAGMAWRMLRDHAGILLANLPPLRTPIPRRQNRPVTGRSSLKFARSFAA